MNTLQQAFNHISGGRVLDVATGGGHFVGVLIENLRDYSEIIGVDANAHALDAAREHVKQDKIHFQLMDATRLDLPDASFDTVAIAHSLHHLENLPRTFAEMQRVLKPGGRVIIAETYRDHQTETQLTNVYLHDWWAAVDSALGVSHRETYTRQEILNLISDLNLRDWVFYEYATLEKDPADARIIKQLDARLDQYGERAQNAPDALALLARGEELRARLHAIGFHGATTLIAIGQK
ncbi:MAG: class I SAM-dependent methyltransferase [Anaerolineales bacterium]|nr:class I SAM-dependent methyltransferase [Anaerolineales bacterium]